MMRLVKLLLAAVVALATAAPLPAAQAAPYSQAELDQMLAPIALYPDALLSQILLAATCPLEVVEAARWSRANPGLQGDEAVRAVQQEYWDPGVKSLVAFPQLLARMDEKLEWTKTLGDAFFVQEPVVMETIQELRRRARAAGQLTPDDRLRVYDDGQAIVIEPATPQVVYVPYYDPWVVYGPWWWSTYPPVAWAPWPGYVVARRPGVSAGFWWGPGIGVSIGLMFGSVDWFQRRVRVPVRPGYSRPVIIHRDAPLPRRIAPEPVAPAPRIEPRPQPRAERPYPRREMRPDGISPESRRIERAPRTEAPRQPKAKPVQPPTQHIERVPQIQPQPAQVPRIQPQAQPQPVQAPRIEHAPKAVPQRGEPGPRREAREAQEGQPRSGGARP